VSICDDVYIGKKKPVEKRVGVFFFSHIDLEFSKKKKTSMKNKISVFSYLEFRKKPIWVSLSINRGY
jgi:hypothetical protein